MRKKFFTGILLFLFLTFPFLSVFADVVELDNGSKIVGDIEQFDKKSLRIKTDFAGLVTIDLKRVIRFSSDKPLHVAFDGQTRKTGLVTWSKEEIRITQPDGNIFVSQVKPDAAWKDGMRDPFRRHWTFQVGLDVAGKTGNAEKVAAGGKAQAVLEGPDDKLLLYARSAYTRDDGVLSDNAVVGGIDFERRFYSGKHSVYARTELEHDEIKGLKLSSTTALGYGYYFLKNANHALRGRAGLLYRYNSWNDDRTDSTAGVDLSVYHMYQFNNSWKLLNEVVYTPDISDYLDYHIYHESSLLIPVAASEIWKLQLGVSNDYYSQPPADKEYLDTYYFARLVFQWK